ncbi:GATA zinc finger domain-containing protein 24-like [Nasonia vitripennis]|uniref:Uncharacterized protein n=1 Tax=Nasonia vitripennis TaxID=7425 RepID=A0A7M7ITL9_NASVI|nr:GATA zinc finger domain-containing protein 24-like [Nasonia vitripennis]
MPAGKRAVQHSVRLEELKKFKEIFDENEYLLPESNAIWTQVSEKLDVKRRNIYEYVHQDRQNVTTNLLKYFRDNENAKNATNCNEREENEQNDINYNLKNNDQKYRLKQCNKDSYNNESSEDQSCEEESSEDQNSCEDESSEDQISCEEKSSEKKCRKN